MNKAKTTIEIAKECGADFEHANSEIVTSYASDVLIFSQNSIEAFRKACIADYKSRCELKAYISSCDNFIEYRKDALKELSFKDSDIHGLFTLPNDGE